MTTQNPFSETGSSPPRKRKSKSLPLKGDAAFVGEQRWLQEKQAMISGRMDHYEVGTLRYLEGFYDDCYTDKEIARRKRSLKAAEECLPNEHGHFIDIYALRAKLWAKEVQ